MPRQFRMLLNLPRWAQLRVVGKPPARGAGNKRKGNFFSIDRRKLGRLGVPCSRAYPGRIGVLARAIFFADADVGAPRGIRGQTRMALRQATARLSLALAPAWESALKMEGEAVLSRKNTARTCLSWRHSCLSLCCPCPCCRHEKLVALGGDAYTPRRRHDDLPMRKRLRRTGAWHS
jgi:hypothetical protein